MKNIRSIQIILIVLGISLLVFGIVSLFMVNYIESGLSFYLLVASIFVNSAWIVIFQYDRGKRKEEEAKAAAEVAKYTSPRSSSKKKKKKKK